MEIKTHADWLSARLKGIGASEASAVIGCNPYMDNVSLWRRKTDRETAPDIGDKPCVQYGHAAEPLLRGLFALDYPAYQVEYGGAYDMVHNPDYPFIFATLDGRLTEKTTGRKGILEIKTTEILKSMQREKWAGQLPHNYYVQLLHQLLATGWEFAVLHAQLKFCYGGDIKTERRTYFVERAEVQADLDTLLREELRFWGYVQEDREPPLQLPEI